MWYVNNTRCQLCDLLIISDCCRVLSLCNVCLVIQISEKQRSLYEALEKQQHYQGSLQSISSKMEALEAKLSEPVEADKSPDSHVRAQEVSPAQHNRSLKDKADQVRCWHTRKKNSYGITKNISLKT